MSELDDLVAKIQSKLASGDALDKLADIALAGAFELPVSTYLDASRFVELAVAAIDEERIARALREVVRPGIDRQKAVLEQSGDALSKWVPPDAHAMLDEIAKRAKRPDGAWAKSAIEPRDIRELVAPVIQDALLAFARKLPMVGGGSEGKEESRAGKLLSGLAKGIAQNAGAQAQKLADLGRGVLGGLGAEMEKRVATAAKEFSEAAFEPIGESFAHRVASDEGQAILARIRGRVIDTVLNAKAGELLADADALPADALDAFIAKTLAHDIAQPEVRALIAQEVDAFLAPYGAQSLGAVLADWKMKDVVAAEAKRQLLNIARPALARPDFEGWLRDLLS